MAKSTACLKAPIAQRIERWPPKPKAQVRVLVGACRAPVVSQVLFLCLIAGRFRRGAGELHFQYAADSPRAFDEDIHTIVDIFRLVDGLHTGA